MVLREVKVTWIRDDVSGDVLRMLNWGVRAGTSLGKRWVGVMVGVGSGSSDDETDEEVKREAAQRAASSIGSAVKFRPSTHLWPKIILASNASRSSVINLEGGGVRLRLSLSIPAILSSISHCSKALCRNL